jgi:hypothetical protein
MDIKKWKKSKNFNGNKDLNIREQYFLVKYLNF